MIKEIEAKSILIYNKKPSSWFGVHYYLNIYRGCSHGCIYCDSRSECYQIDNFDEDISIKTNAPLLLRENLIKKRYKNTIGFGSTSDPYIPLELEYELTRKCLEIIKELRFPLFILTKSNLVLRDLDLISAINEQNYACVAFTITGADDKLAKKIEPNAPLPSQRFEAIKILSSMGVKCGVVIMPMLPFITDNKENIKALVVKAKDAGASFVYCDFGMTLRDRQRDYYYEKIGPKLALQYKKRYKNYYSCPSPNYSELKAYFNRLCKEYDISNKMPSYDAENANIQLNLFE